MHIIAAGTADEVLTIIENHATDIYRTALNEALEFLNHGILDVTDTYAYRHMTRDQILDIKMAIVEATADDFRAATFTPDPRD